MATLDKSMQMEYPVKNTFIEYPCMRSISLEMFFKERETQSEPSKLMSRLESLEDDFPTLDPSVKDSDSAKIEYLVKNTFIDGLADYPALRSRSLEEFLMERRTNSCPNSGITQRLESLEEEPCMALDKMSEFPSTPSSSFYQRGSHLENMESLEEGEEEAPPEDSPAMVLLTSSPMRFPTMPGSLQGHSQQHKDETPAMYMGNFNHLRAYSDRSTMAPSDGDIPHDFAQFPAEQKDAQFLGMPPARFRALALEEEKELPVEQLHENVGDRTVVVELNSVLNHWSVGSTGHHFGRCKPCAFFWKEGCKAGQACEFCHTCPVDEKKKRTKQKMAWRRTMKAARVSLRYGLF